MLTRKLILFCGIAVTVLITAPLILSQEPGTRCTRYKAKPDKQKSSKPQAGRTAKDLDTLVEALKAQGLNVERADDVSQPFFSIEGRALTVNGENVQVFRYPTTEAAGREAGQVSPDGSSVGTSMMSWMAPPHFYRKDNVIVLYVGGNGEVLRALQSVLGAQFAGR
jgi:hypothetical protein